jgi:hypothetical protein
MIDLRLRVKQETGSAPLEPGGTELRGWSARSAWGTQDFQPHIARLG